MGYLVDQVKREPLKDHGSSEPRLKPPLVINVDAINIDDDALLGHADVVTTYIGAGEAAGILGVTKPTLYAYVSRGIIDRRLAIDGRSSLYDRAAIEQLAVRSRRRGPSERPSIDVRISTGVTLLDDEQPTYRGRSIIELATSCSYEQVAELLLTGDLPATSPRYVPHDVERLRTVVDEASPADPIIALAVASLAMNKPATDADGAAETARRLLALSPSVLGGPADGGLASRLARTWSTRPTDELVAAINAALVLLADHELATSTLAVRVAASVRTPPAASLATGLSTVAGRLHGGASRRASELFLDAERLGAASAVDERLASGQRLPGFGHTVYRTGDPRFAPLLAAVDELPNTGGRLDVVHDSIRAAGSAIGHLPNVDLALGALMYVARLPIDAPIFAVARIPGWAAHYDEELGERPVRFRGLATTR